MPIQEYIYDSDDEESRQRAMEDAANTGSLAQFFHAKDTEFKLTEAGNKTGSADVYERLCERCNNEISKLVLGNTLTTESSENGTQALGTVHKKVEDKVAQADKNYVLNVLNYDMSDIFARMGINTAGGVFCFPEKKEIDSTTKLNIITTLKSNFNLPVSDDYLYEEFGVEKPDNYEQIKKEREEQPPHNNIPVQAPETKEEKDPEPTTAQKKSFRNWIASFFGKAPSDGGAALDW